ncbi:XRE family transcriptional regulator [Bifidobacterium phasiani]|uniref:Sigma-70 family RNA polymerase sigma factor n=1 Tax=Bifidobacterium phasiani TaxID=2834431 RepID=A0ABS6W9Q4_9BIFI|nr:XRE family transcriptional regulator [Bifidobacterium phasiani]MBW3083157.1 sigma-70 family RNA polymerase sigma factor [Bifidobacterium phasiani]
MNTIDVTAIAERSGDWWAIEVPEMPGLFTQVRRLDQVDTMVRDAATAMGRNVGAIAVSPRLSAHDQAMIDELLATRQRALRLQDAASTMTRNAIAALRGEGLTVRDVASIIGISPQRVSALLATAPRR